MFMLMGIGYAIWILPETFGKSLEEMVCRCPYFTHQQVLTFVFQDLVFGSGQAQEDATRMERILQHLHHGESLNEKEKGTSSMHSVA